MSAPSLVAPLQQPLSRWATTYPSASRVFQKYGLDFCCRGNRPLEAACRDRSIDPASVLEQILEAEEQPRDFRNYSLRQLVDHVLSRYHQTARAELPDLISMAQRVEERHAEKSGCPHGLSALLATWGGELFEHMEKEELVLFPLFLSSGGTRAVAPVVALNAEHQDHGRALGQIRALTTDLVPPQGACPTWRALYLRLSEFERDLMEHVAFEQEILFPRGLSQGA